MSLTVSERAAPDNRKIVKLNLHDLLTGGPREAIVLADEPFSEAPRAANRLLAAGGRRVMAVENDRVFLVTLDETVLRRFVPPFAFKLQQSELTLDPQGPTKLKHGFRGAESPMEVSVAPRWPGIEIEPRSGELTIDGPALGEFVVKTLATSTTSRGLPAISASGTGEDGFNEYLCEVKLRFQQIAGRPAKGAPVLVPIGLIARDKSQQIARLNYQIFLEVPEERALGAFRQRAEIARKRQEESVRAAGERVKGPSDLAKRVDAIEERLSRLEAQTELLTRLVAKTQEQPSPKPQNRFEAPIDTGAAGGCPESRCSLAPSPCARGSQRRGHGSPCGKPWHAAMNHMP